MSWGTCSITSKVCFEYTGPHRVGATVHSYRTRFLQPDSACCVLYLDENPFLTQEACVGVCCGGNIDVTLLCCHGENLMYAQCIRSWRLLGYSRHSLCPLSSLKGFTLELLDVCTYAATVSSASAAVAGRSCLVGSGLSGTLGLYWRTLAIRCLFVPVKKRKIYRGYVEQSVWLSECE